MTTPDATSPTAQRQQRHAVLARAATATLEDLWRPYAPRVVASPLRVAEAGMVMLRGRIGGDGAPFNLGEATVSRAVMTVKVDGAEAVGVGYVLGRERRRAELVALFDALAQLPAFADEIDHAVVAPLARAQRAAREAAHAATAASRVEFFTLVRGET